MQTSLENSQNLSKSENSTNLNTDSRSTSTQTNQVGGTGNSPVIFAEFSDAYSLRNLIEYLKSTNVHGDFIFSKDKIIYAMSDADRTILNEIVILGCNLPYYIYNSPSEYVVVGMTISNLRKITKSIGKKDSVRLYMLPNDPLLYIQIMSMNTKALSRSNINIIKPQQAKENVEYDTMDLQYTRGEDNPNCTVPIVDFCRMCTAMNSIQCTHVTIRGLPRGAIFEGIMEGGLTGRIDRFGICEGYTSSKSSNTDGGSLPDLSVLMEDLQVDKIKMPTTGKTPKLVIQSNEAIENRIRVKISTIKALSKINNLSTAGGIIKLYIEEDMPLKLVVGIGTYGKLTIYLRSVDN